MASVMIFDAELIGKESSIRIVRPSGIVRTYTGIGRNRLRPSDSDSEPDDSPDGLAKIDLIPELTS